MEAVAVGLPTIEPTVFAPTIGSMGCDVGGLFTTT